MLEDDFTYVLRKSLLGHSLSPAAAAQRAGIPETDVLAFLRGAFSPKTARSLAPVLGLNAEAFARHAVYQPAALLVAGIERLDLPFGRDQVNAWLVSAGDSLVLFDAGCEPEDLLRELEARGRMPDRVFITHAHHDHIGGLPQLLRAGVPVHAAGIPGTLPMSPGETVSCGQMVISACDLSGHAEPALGFQVEGLVRPVLVMGDSLFAGSIGGCGSPAIYQHALRRLQEVLSPLPDETVLLPGHGPATTLGEERVSNPFL